jgi:molybdopterin synthase catalytic subunit
MSKATKNIFIQGAISPEFISTSIGKHAAKTEIGAHSIFLGQVRADMIDGKKVESIEYTTYQEMALEKMTELREQLFAKFELTCLHVYHSLGIVKTGEICLFVFASSSHRKNAIAACEELVERIKAELPVWGKEILEEGEHQWKINQ